MLDVLHEQFKLNYLLLAACDSSTWKCGRRVYSSISSCSTSAPARLQFRVSAFVCLPLQLFAHRVSTAVCAYWLIVRELSLPTHYRMKTRRRLRRSLSFYSVCCLACVCQHFGPTLTPFPTKHYRLPAGDPRVSAAGCRLDIHDNGAIST